MTKLLVAFAACAAIAAAENAEQVYKNITALKGTPADQLLPAMQFISASLGVECNFCHVPGKPEADDKAPKKTAREMISMTAMINKNAFNGRNQVTCYSCHHGSGHPSSVPPVLESDAAMPRESRPATPAGPAPTADEIVQKYIAAVGGAEAMKKITSRHLSGVILVGGNETPIELFTKAPNKRISITHNANGESITAFDGTKGWLGNTGRPPREMSAAESAAAGLDAEFYLPLRLKEIFPQLRRARPEQVNGADCDVLTGSGGSAPLARLYFDKSTGLLVRLVRYAETPLGRNPTQIDYADYRDVDGVKTAMRWTLSRPNGRFTIQIKEAKSNVEVDDARFEISK